MQLTTKHSAKLSIRLQNRKVCELWGKTGQCISNLKSELCREMLLKGWSVAQLSIQCDLSYKAMYNIINKETEDMRLSTFVRICDNVGISLVKVLEISNSEIIDDGLSKALITCGGNRYILKRIF